MPSFSNCCAKGGTSQYAAHSGSTSTFANGGCLQFISVVRRCSIAHYQMVHLALRIIPSVPSRVEVQSAAGGLLNSVDLRLSHVSVFHQFREAITSTTWLGNKSLMMAAAQGGNKNIVEKITQLLDREVRLFFAIPYFLILGNFLRK